MSAMGPSATAYQCAMCQFKSAARQGIRVPTRRAFHSSPISPIRSRVWGPAPATPRTTGKKRSPQAAVAASPANPETAALEERLRDYTQAQIAQLRKRYTPSQMEALKMGEQAIDTADLIKQGRFRSDPLRMTYIDDFAQTRPLVDELPAGASAAPEEDVGRDRRGRKAKAEAEPEAVDARMLRLCQQTGLSKEEIAKLRVKVLVDHRVVNQTRMGKIQSMYFLAIAGNENGMLGLGEGKATEVEDAQRQAQMNAIRNMKPIPRYEDRTIYGDVQAKVAASIVQLSARPPGFGNRCQHLIFEVARAAGISDLSARTPRSRNKMNVVKATFEALTNQRVPDDVARARGRKLVDVRGVYYGGLVY